MADGTERAREASGGTRSASVATTGAPPTRSRVLIIDDDQGLSRLISLVLRGAGFDADVANSGDDGLRLMGDKTYDVVVLDLKMPGKDGREVFKEMREAGVRTPVMILSAYDARRASEDLGSEAYMNKPFEPDKLVEVLNSLLGKAPAN